jgi:hypothetical protein
MWEQMGAAMARGAEEMAKYPAVYTPTEIVFQEPGVGTVTEFLGSRAISNYVKRRRNRTKTPPAPEPVVVSAGPVVEIRGK